MKKTILCILLIFLFSSCSTQDISQNSDRFSEFTFGLEQYIDIIHNDLYPIIISDEKELNSKLFDNQVLKITKSTMDSFFLENIYLKNVTPLENNIFELNIIYKNYFDKLFNDCIFKIEAVNSDEYKITDYSFVTFDISNEIELHWKGKAYDHFVTLPLLRSLLG
ncbi:MAG: hypothetical protein RR806_06275 [Oscillospiraceae bacterium]